MHINCLNAIYFVRGNQLRENNKQITSTSQKKSNEHENVNRLAVRFWALNFYSIVLCIVKWLLAYLSTQRHTAREFVESFELFVVLCNASSL